VAVVYADWQTAGAPDPRRVLPVAAALDCAAVLVDTFDKRAGDLTTIWNSSDLETLVAAVRSLGMMSVLAGSLSAQTIPLVLRHAPDAIAVRGAACAGGREGSIDAQRVRMLSRLVRGTARSL
jgi:hypothetical protein